ncbi:MAG TPA: protein kinase [Thermoanaerobaculia bacterium]|nr:protein kinase [Thermoanaerobaculia bacterium]
MLHPGQSLGSYRLSGRLGEGGMGEVWKAEDTRLGRMVAIKILPPILAQDPEAMHRMRLEARTVAQLDHENIATIYEFEELPDRSFIVMELVEGEPLSNIIARGRMTEGDVCRIGRAIADALAEAHAKGIVHRDIKPDNVIVNGPRVKVLDFGIAKRTGPEALAANDAFRTRTGFIMGTVCYMSPEQTMGRQLDARSDLFSLGIVLYEMLTGRLPFEGESATETMMIIARDEPKPLHGVSPGLAWIVRRCLAKMPEERFASAREVGDALDRQFGHSPTSAIGPADAIPPTAPMAVAPPRRSRWPLFALVSVVAIVAVLFAVLLLVPDPPTAASSKVGAATTSTVTVKTSIDVAADAPSEDEEAELGATTTTAVVIEQVDRPKTGEKTAEDFFNEGLIRLVERQPFRAREAFESAVERDPTHARAHFRLGEMALFGRDFATAREEFDAALEHGDRLDARETKLTELGLAVLDRDRDRAMELVEEVGDLSPNDPDLVRFRELVEGTPRPPLRALRPRE